MDSATSNTEPFATTPRVSGVISRVACANARRAGIPLAPLLRKAHLTAQQIDDPQHRLPARAQVRLLSILADALRDDLLGMHVARAVEPREMGLLFYVLASSRNLLEALKRAVRYGTLVNEGVAQRCSVGTDIEITLDYVGVSRHLDCHQAECWMALLVRMLRQLTGLRIVARRVRFVHARSSAPAELAAFFGSEVEFGADADRISFARSLESVPLLRADPYLNKLLVKYCEEALAHRRAAQESFRTRIENAVVPLLPHVEANVTVVARQFGISRRTLTRRLAQEGIGFPALLDRLRYDLSHRYLTDGDTSISQIAWLLGYQNVSAFSRAFRRWTGQSPRQSRRQRMVS